MRSFIIGCVISLAACASSSGLRPINVHAVRVDIKDAIAANPGEPGPRAILSMGKVTGASAVVFTEGAGGARREESWVKSGSGWGLSEVQAITASTAPAAR